MSARSKSKILLAATFFAVALLASSIPAIAAARSSVFEAPSQMNLSFARGTARVIGRDALILVKCTGSQNGTCSGTVTLSAGGRKHRAPFSVIGGGSQSLTVPVGSGKDLSGTSGLAVARTAQPSGGSARSSEVLHFR
ncbi:MAG TPA: hypothetical protein VII45_02260 [Solirubrobacterales bacterium]